MSACPRTPARTTAKTTQQSVAQAAASPLLRNWEAPAGQQLSQTTSPLRWLRGHSRPEAAECCAEEPEQRPPLPCLPLLPSPSQPTPSEAQSAAGLSARTDAPRDEAQPVNVGAVEAVAPAPRRRLVSKRQPPDAYWSIVAAQFAAKRPVYKARQKAEQLYAARSGTSVEGSNYEERRSNLVAAFRNLDAVAQAPWLWAAVHNRETWVKPTPTDQDDAEAQPGRAQAIGLLLTWNGDWLSQDPIATHACRVALAQHAWPDQAVAELAHVASMRRVFDDMWSQVFPQCTHAGLTNVSAAMELSTHARHSPRVHLHVYASFPGGIARLTPLMQRGPVFDGIPAHNVQRGQPGRGANKAGRTIAQGHFYLQAGKAGSLLRRSNFIKNQHFRATWPMIRELWQLGKLSHASARLEIEQSRDNVQRALSEINAVERLEGTREAQRRAAIQREQHGLLPWKPYSAVVLEWLGQYRPRGGTAPCAVDRRRFKTLVFDGRSRTGKTEFAMSIFGCDATFVVSCQRAVEPNLTRWNPLRYAAIVLEETDWQIVWSNRQLFQAGVNSIMLGQSQCNQSCYDIFLCGVPLMLTSNHFWADCPSGGPEEQWLRANIFYERVDHPLWREMPSV